MTSLTSMCEMACQIVQKKLEEKQLYEEQAAKAQSWKLPVWYDDDDDEESSKSLEDNIISELPPYSAVTLSEPVDSLSMGDEHLNTILVTESDEFIKSSVENLVPNPSESEGENGCDSFSDEDFPKKIYSNPLFDEEINPMKIDQHPFNAESDLIESMPNHDSSITISLKIDFLFGEFAGELTLLKSISPGIDETDCHPEKETRFAKRLFNSHMEEIDLPFALDDPMPPSIEDDDYDSRRDIMILEELLDNYSLSLPASESYHFDIPLPYRPFAKPPNGNTGTLNIKMMGDVSDQKAVVATSLTKAEYVATASCCAQLLWIQNQLLDYGLILTAVSLKLMFFGLTIDASQLMLLGHKTLPLIIQNPTFNFSLFIIPTIIMALSFANTHNMITFVTKSDAIDGFDQIVDFLNAHVIQYALMANDVMRLQALIDRRKVIITKDTIRQALYLDDADSVDCLLNDEIFAELARMGYEKPSTKLTFYKAYFSAQ
nr:uncharacterized mitochondrial protein AtMg00810-like [Tanacetum cinerariifolium]